MQKAADAFRTISEVADDLSLPQHVLRFWETRFPQIRPLKRAGGRRYYRPADVLLLRSIRQLLYDDGYTIKGVQRLLKEQGARGLGTGARAEDQNADTETASDPVAFDDLSAGVADLAPAVPREIRPREEMSTPDAASEPVPDRDRQTFRDLVQEALSTIDDCRTILDAALHPPARCTGSRRRHGPTSLAGIKAHRRRRLTRS